MFLPTEKSSNSSGSIDSRPTKSIARFPTLLHFRTPIQLEYASYGLADDILEFDPFLPEDLGEIWGTRRHRRHIFHGVVLPPRLLRSCCSKEDVTKPEKLLEWATDAQWIDNACESVKKNVGHR